jgi:YesN/AraC family two-component response regulator
MPSIRTLLVDDEPDVRLVMRLAIEAENDGMCVVGEAEDGMQAVAAAADLDPSVVVLDVRMPHLDGLQAAAQILAVRPDQAIILCSAYFDRELRRDATKLGIRECVAKTDLVDIPQVIRRVAALVA